MGPGKYLQTESALGCLGNELLGYRRLPSQARFATKKVDTSVNSVVTKPIPKARIEQLMSLMGDEFLSATTSTSKGQATMTQGY